MRLIAARRRLDCKNAAVVGCREQPSRLDRAAACRPLDGPSRDGLAILVGARTGKGGLLSYLQGYLVGADGDACQTWRLTKLLCLLALDDINVVGDLHLRIKKTLLGGGELQPS